MIGYSLFGSIGMSGTGISSMNCGFSSKIFVQPTQAARLPVLRTGGALKLKGNEWDRNVRCSS